MTSAVALALLAALGAAPKFAPYASKADGFSVDLPGTPEVETEKEDGPEGPSVTRTYTATSDLGAYLISVTDDPSMAALIKAGKAETGLDAFRDSQKKEASIVSEKKLSLGAIPGREFKTRGKELDSVVHVYLDGSRLFALMVATPHGVAPEPAGLKQFFDSFRIGASGGAPKAEAAPADGVYAVLDGLAVKDAGKGAAHAVTVSWTATIKAEPGAAAITLASACRVNEDYKKATRAVTIGADKKGQAVPMSVTLPAMKGKLEWCELTFGWGPPNKPTHDVDLECWQGGKEPPYAGPCAD